MKHLAAVFSYHYQCHLLMVFLDKYVEEEFTKHMPF